MRVAQKFVWWCVAVSSIFMFESFEIANAQKMVAQASEDQRALHVLNRLGYGPHSGDIALVKQVGVERYIEQQLNPQLISLSPEFLARLNKINPNVENLSTLLHEEIDLRRQVKALKNENNEVSKDASQNPSVTNATSENPNKAIKQNNPQIREARQQLREQILAQSAHERLFRAIESPRQLEEVMVDFWFNHFNVYQGKGITKVLIADYERSAIRPYALGNFRDLLGATAKHPAMLFYLDNWLSSASTENLAPFASSKQGKAGKIGRLENPDFVNKKKNQGLNENYARELMELHTLGVNGGYTQQDVTELARMLTGWTFKRYPKDNSNDLFYFDARRHDVGRKVWLGKSIEPNGIAEGEYALDVLAKHPATAKFISFKLAQYFVADEPSPALVSELQKRFLASNGNIREVLKTLFASAEFWQEKNMRNKFKTPYQYVISIARAADFKIENFNFILNALKQLGMPLYGSQTPDGYKNTEGAWLNQETLTRRINFVSSLNAKNLSKQLGDANPLGFNGQALFTVLGGLISDKTRQAIVNQPVDLQPALILGSPDFMRR